MAHLVLIRADLLHHQGVARLGDGGFDGVDDVGVEGVGNAADHKSDVVGVGAYQLPGGVVGDVVGALYHRLHAAAALVAHVGSVVQHAGHGGDTDAAETGDIFNGHGRILHLSY